MRYGLPWKTISHNLNNFLQHKKEVILDIDREAVHRMRVSGRRLRISLWCFKSAFPEKEYREIINVIRNTCRSLSRARDLDTQISILTKLKAGKPAIAPLSRRRKKLQPGIKRLLSGLDESRIRAKMEKYLKTGEACLDKSILYKIGRKKIMGGLDKLLSHKGNGSMDELHSLRIHARQLRYTLEIFRPLYPGRLAPCISKARRIQKKLGDMRNYSLLSKNRSCGKPALKNRLMRRAEKSYMDFGKIWADRSGWKGLDALTKISPSGRKRPLPE
ncbi:MAG: CHAD domain-containing protein [Candidatus Omnitrophica bacterium]|nr:CHAD domain-containing protein [Candidatus Omnitrophota bacterium]MDD5500310.1 CHAD domain-containing protein [Candidatus Omnitrophota bacterium]